MGSPANGSGDAPLSPLGRLFLQPQLNLMVYCVMGFKNPIDIDSIKSHLKNNSPILSHPRFSSLLVRDSRGVEQWQKASHIDLDRHIIVLHDPITTTAPVDHETAVNKYLADLSVCSTSQLNPDKPLWEFHILMAHNCAIFRIHHALGDGASLMSLLLASCRTCDDEQKLPTLACGKRSSNGRVNNGGKKWWGLLVGFLSMVWFNLVFVVEILAWGFLWVSDRKTKISGGDGVELLPRKLATARFKIQDMKIVKKAVPNATINDVLLGVVSLGLSRYLEHRTPADEALPEGLQITGLAMVNLRRQPQVQELSDMLMKRNINTGSSSSWGNKFGLALLPVYYHKSKGSDPLLYLKRAKAMIDRRKKSAQPYFSNKTMLFVMSCFGPKVSTWLNHRILCRTSFVISNVPGPLEEVTFAGNPVTYLRVNSSSFPHALIMHMVSYAGRADMQILVAKDIIPDPEFLAQCFEEALLDMKQAATAAAAKMRNV